MLPPSASRKSGRERYILRREVRRSIRGVSIFVGKEGGGRGGRWVPGRARSERRSRRGPCPAFGAAMRVLRGGMMSWRGVFEGPRGEAPRPRRRRCRGNALRKLMFEGGLKQWR